MSTLRGEVQFKNHINQGLCYHNASFLEILTLTRPLKWFKPLKDIFNDRVGPKDIEMTSIINLKKLMPLLVFLTGCGNQFCFDDSNCFQENNNDIDIQHEQESIDIYREINVLCGHGNIEACFTKAQFLEQNGQAEDALMIYEALCFENVHLEACELIDRYR